MSTLLTITQYTALKARLDDQFACSWWDMAIHKKWRIRGSKKTLVSPHDARILYLFKIVTDDWDPTDGAYNYITEKQVTQIFKKANEIANC